MDFRTKINGPTVTSNLNKYSWMDHGSLKKLPCAILEPKELRRGGCSEATALTTKTTVPSFSMKKNIHGNPKIVSEASTIRFHTNRLNSNEINVR